MAVEEMLAPREPTRHLSEAERHLLEPLEALELPTILELAGTAVRANQGLAAPAGGGLALVDILGMAALVVAQGLILMQQQVLAVVAEEEGMQ